MTGYNSFKYLSDYEAKKQIIAIGKRMYDKGFVASNDGNISCRVGPNTIWTTPTGVSKGFMTPDMLVKMNFDGKVLMGKLKPSSEVKMHLRVYNENPDVMAVTHAHPPVATSFAIAGISLDRAILPEAVVNLGSVPIAHYATPGSQDVPDSIAPYCNTHNAVLLANHGALSWGKDLTEAYHRLESLEYYATVLMYTGRIIGRANELSCSQVNELIDIREKLGITSGGTPPCSLKETNTTDVVKTEKPLTAYQASGCSVSSAGTEKEAMIRELTQKITQQVLESLKR
ncbi:MAG: class II aldolase/adducin family protein [Proteocatella sp.]|nr:class II aldolase/adducin family protein [Proteocatella sp.]MBP8654138.1 class II aldolase/adducin family protein [Proteocatella sp.]MBP9658752.1 class II aldolase/adducin family protein [Proteocatella sp.]NCB70366.1 class II aldolase/adducin family protein [Clostridia bacterium]